ncbi:MAG: MraY family glycosyltransferase [Sulfurovum sp.]
MTLELAIIFILSLLFIYLLRKYAKHLELIDKPNSRSIHTQNTPRGGGIAFFFAIFLVFPFFHWEILTHYPYIILSIIIIFISGVIDDIKEVKPLTKFLVILISTLLLYIDNISINSVGVFGGDILFLGYLSLPFTFFAVSGFTNALNLIDGLDGLSTTISLLILSTFLYIGFIYQDEFMIIVSIVVITSLLAFLLYNWYPASIFMGDSGSLTLGFIISILAIKSLEHLSSAVTILFLTALPILDTMIVMIRRKLKGGSAFQADRCHLHHIILNCFTNSTPKTVIFIFLLQLLYIFIGLSVDSRIDGLSLLILFILQGVGLYHLLGYLIKKQT